MIAPQPAVDWSDWFAGRVSRMRASEIRELLKLLERPDVVSFAGGIPDPALFPMDAIRAAFAQRNEGEDRNRWLYSYNPLTVELR